MKKTLYQIIGFLFLALLIALALALPVNAVTEGRGPTIPLECGTFKGEYICRMDGNFTFEGPTATLGTNWSGYGGQLAVIDGVGNAYLNSDSATLIHRLFNRSQTNNWSMEYSMKLISLSNTYQLSEYSNRNISAIQGRVWATQDEGGTLLIDREGTNYCSGFLGAIEGDGIFHHFVITFLGNNSIKTFMDGTEKCDSDFGGAVNVIETVAFGFSIDQDLVGSALYDNMTFYNGTSYPGTFTLGDTANPSANITNKNASDSLKFGNVLNISVFAQDETALSTGNITFNLTGNNDLYNFSFTLSGTSAFFSQNITINLTRGSVINATVWVYDGTNYGQNSTLITIANTIPTISIVNPIANTLYNRQPLGINVTYSDADNDAITEIKWWINNSLNQTIALGAGVTGNTTFNASDGKYNLSVAVYDGTQYGSNATISSFKIDTANPMADLATIMPNLTFTRINANFTVTATDNNLYGHNVSCYTGDDTSGQIKFSLENTAISAGSNTIKIETNTSWGDGRYTCMQNASDDHTKKIEEPYLIIKDIATLKLDIYTTESADDVISIKLKSSDIGLLDFTAYPDADLTKWVYVFNFSNTTPNSNINHTYVLKFNSQKEKLIFRNQSKYPSHLVTSENWIDCNLKTDYSSLTSYSTKEAPIGSGGYETTITTPETTLICESIGGVNRIGVRTQIEVDTGVPEFNYLNISRNGLLANRSFVNNATLNLSYNVSDKNNQSVVFYINNLKNISAGYISNTTQNATITFDDGNYTMLIEINDSAGNKLNSTLMQFAVDTIAPIDSNALNRTALSNSTDILDSTDVNLTVHLGDIYLHRINISHNASGSWINHSFDGTGNGTYHLIIKAENLTANQVVGWKYDAFDLAGNQLDPINIFTVGNSVSGISPSSGGGGGGGSSSFEEELYAPCLTYISQWQTCYYKDTTKNLCIKGCPSGYACSGIICEFTNATIIAQSEAQAQGRWQTLKNLFKGLFNPNTPLSLITQENPINSPETSPEPIVEGVTAQIAAKIQNSPEIAIAVVLAVLLGIAIWAYGFIFLFTNPLILGIMAVILFLAYLIINYGVFK